MKKILNIAILVILVIGISLLLELPTPVMIFGIYFVINIATLIEKNKAKNKKSQANKDPRSIPGKNTDDNEALRNLREQTSTKNIEDIVVEIANQNNDYAEIDYENIYNNEQKKLEEQMMLYNNSVNNIKNNSITVKEINAVKGINTQASNTRSQKNVFLSTLSIEQAIIYDAMLNPKRLNYRFLKKV